METRWKECKIQQVQGYLSVYSKKLRFRSWIAYFSEQQKASLQRSNNQKQLSSNSLYCWCYWQSLHIFIIHYCRTKECLEYKKKSNVSHIIWGAYEYRIGELLLSVIYNMVTFLKIRAVASKNYDIMAEISQVLVEIFLILLTITCNDLAFGLLC